MVEKITFRETERGIEISVDDEAGLLGLRAVLMSAKFVWEPRADALLSPIINGLLHFIQDQLTSRYGMTEGDWHDSLPEETKRRIIDEVNYCVGRHPGIGDPDRDIIAEALYPFRR